ncbi:cytosolic sulfotransferase 18-like [Phragmites australis]|uniref:cytosolic sulfotransferase 18-like n=1 Tax=Phragmites australis TaxID=29695 RepID=UPI002D78797B|nr:cytosolic sulfotransferase 18-like [Phragmites australis]
MEKMQHGNEKSCPTSPPVPRSSQSYTEDLVETLPTREGWSTPLILYKNCWLRSHMLNNFMRVQDNFKPRSNDVILATHPKCGTTWLKALSFAITNRSRYTSADHPLLKQNPQRLVPTIGAQGGDLDDIERLPSPRLLATHLPLSLLPPTVSTNGCRIVYLCREPKDAFISRWHFDNRMTKGDPINLDEAFTMFSEGCSPFGPFWDHYLQYWNESLERPHEVLFLKYEDIVFDPLKVVRNLASFLGVPFTDEEESRGVEEEVVRLCSFEALSSQGVNQKGGVERAGGKIFIEYSSLFRKGKVGDWVNHMSTEMGEKIDLLVEEKFKGSGLKF